MTTVKQKLLVVEDEADLLSVVEYALCRENYRVCTATTGKEALEQLSQDPVPDLVLLDIMLPDISGTELCRRLRQSDRTKHIPVMMLTARGEEIDRVMGFEVGADDYVVKPFSVRELLLRVRAILRRAQPDDDGGSRKEFGLIRIDDTAHRVWIDSTEVILTALEYKLLMTFMSRRGRVQTREMLLNDVWGIHADVTTRTVDTHVKRLRQKLGVACDYIETLRGTGYRFIAELP